jgi:hypothetical protein
MMSEKKRAAVILAAAAMIIVIGAVASGHVEAKAFQGDESRWLEWIVAIMIIALTIGSLLLVFYFSDKLSQATKNGLSEEERMNLSEEERRNYDQLMAEWKDIRRIYLDDLKKKIAEADEMKAAGRGAEKKETDE